MACGWHYPGLPRGPFLCNFIFSHERPTNAFSFPSAFDGYGSQNAAVRPVAFGDAHAQHVSPGWAVSGAKMDKVLTRFWLDFGSSIAVCGLADRCLKRKAVMARAQAFRAWPLQSAGRLPFSFRGSSFRQPTASRKSHHFPFCNPLPSLPPTWVQCMLKPLLRRKKEKRKQNNHVHSSWLNR